MPLLDQNAIMFFARIIAFVTAIPVHEAAHAYVSDKLGDSTARDLGRLTLNPIKHLDLMGFISMLLVGVGWAKPVPVHPERYENPRKGMALTAVAGPLSNLILAFITLVLYKVAIYGMAAAGITSPTGWVVTVITILYLLVIININLAVFNMLPIPPLDGSRLFGLLLPEKAYYKVMQYERYIMFALLILLWMGFLSNFLGFINHYVLLGMNWLTGFVDVFFRLF